MTRTELALRDLYVEDETAWLEATAELIAAGAYSELDYENLREFVTDMALRDRREVESRSVVLLIHVLKWVHQPDQRSRSWINTIAEQRFELARLARKGVLRNHAEAVLAELYPEAVTRAAGETGLPPTAFPPVCAYSFAELLAFDPNGSPS